MLTECLGTVFGNHRKRLDMTLEDLGRKVGYEDKRVAIVSLSKAEKKGPTKIAALVQICDALGIPVLQAVKEADAMVRTLNRIKRKESAADMVPA